MHPTEYSAKAVANNFLLYGNRENIPMTPMKIIKLTYIAHGHFLANTDNSLFSDEVEAWDYGPVIPALYHEFKVYGRFPIDSFAKERKGIKLIPTFALGKEVFQFARKAWNKYKDLDGVELANMTHKDGTPWHKTRYSLEYRNNRRVIDNSLIRDYYLEHFGVNYLE